MKEAIYYQRDHLKAPRVTVCLMKDDNGIVCRGLALCSLDDNPTKKDIEKTYTLPYIGLTFTEHLAGGRTIAKQRARKAFLSKKTSDIIFRDEAIEVLHSVKDWRWWYKSEYDIKPKNKFEEKLIHQMN